MNSVSSCNARGSQARAEINVTGDRLFVAGDPYSELCLNHLHCTCLQYTVELDNM